MPPRVLIVDDEPEWQDKFAYIFRGRGYEAEAAGDTATAKELLAASAYDVLVLDVYLDPEQEPLDYQLFLDFLSTEYPNTTVVVTTGKRLEPDEAFTLKDLGVSAFINKGRIQITAVRKLADELAGDRRDQASRPWYEEIWE